MTEPKLTFTTKDGKGQLVAIENANREDAEHIVANWLGRAKYIPPYTSIAGQTALYGLARGILEGMAKGRYIVLPPEILDLFIEWLETPEVGEDEECRQLIMEVNRLGDAAKRKPDHIPSRAERRRNKR